MRLARFWLDGDLRVGVVDGNEVIDATAKARGQTDLVTLLAGLHDELAALSTEDGATRYVVGDLQLAPPVNPRKFFAIGLNYADHIEEAGLERPTVPMFFNKQPTCVIAGGASIERPRASSQLDYEGELGIVIGRRCRHVTRELAPKVIAGYLIVNDVSIRDWQLASPTLTLGKSWDTHGPIGPWLTAASAVSDPHDLEMATYVNGELRQKSNTRHMVFDCFDQVAHLSTVCTLEPGDVIATGTSSGVGALMDPPGFLAPGDVVRIEIDQLGFLENDVILEPDDSPRIDEGPGVTTCAG
jgi:2-keto-4-pentenoate hydratase/2-oxohepta-3-ene-1,7-dioic acid hydratase in catechol pathway